MFRTIMVFSVTTFPISDWCIPHENEDEPVVSPKHMYWDLNLTSTLQEWPRLS